MSGENLALHPGGLLPPGGAATQQLFHIPPAAKGGFLKQLKSLRNTGGDDSLGLPGHKYPPPSGSNSKCLEART